MSSVHSEQREDEEEEIVEGRGRDGRRGRQMNGQEDVGRKSDENGGNKEGRAEEKVISGREGRMEGRDTGQRGGGRNRSRGRSG